jgi:hypothetical protein
MTSRKSSLYLMAALFLFAPLIALSQAASQSQNASHDQSQSSSGNLSLVINGQSDQPVPVMQMNGHSYVEMEALAHAVQGTLSFRGNRVELTLPGAGAPASSANQGFSKAFLRAGIEEMGVLREWHTALASAIQNSFPLGGDWLGRYRARANDNLRLVAVAAATDADRNAYQLLSNEFQNMSQLSDKYLAQRANLSYISPDALDNDDLNQRIVACGHALGAMAGSGQFVDDPSCH